MKWIDMHCDTLSRLQNLKNENLMENSCCVDLRRLKTAGAAAQFFACFVDAAEYRTEDAGEQKGRIYWEAAAARADEMIGYAQKAQGEGFVLAGSPEELAGAEEKGVTAGILTVEEGGILNGKPERIRELHEKGVRLITLTWNYENCLGMPNSRNAEIMGQGLKPFGFQTVEEMNRLKMVIDVSHLSDGGFYDCVRHSRKPVVASHSNARALCPHPRNLSDEMLRLLGENGGAAGVNFYGRFLRETGRAGLDDLVRHITWMISRAGEDAVALGTDFDGFPEEDLPDGIRGVSDLPVFFQKLEDAGISYRQIEKLASGNVKRILGEVMA